MIQIFCINISNSYKGFIKFYFGENILDSERSYQNVFYWREKDVALR
jgi:hypothetical protein